MNYSIRPNKFFFIFLFFILFLISIYVGYKKYKYFKENVIEEFTLKLARKRLFFYRINNIKISKKYWGYLVSYYVPFAKIGDSEYKPGLLFFKNNKPYVVIPKKYYSPGDPIYFFSGLTVFPLKIFVSKDLPNFYLIELNAPDLEIPGLNYTTSGIKFFILTGLEGKKPIFQDYEVDLNGFVVNEYLEPVGYSYNRNLYFKKLFENINWDLFDEFLGPTEIPKVILNKQVETEFGPPTAYRRLFYFSIFNITRYKLPVQYITIRAKKVDILKDLCEFNFYFPNLIKDNVSLEILNSTWPHKMFYPEDNITYINGKIKKLSQGVLLKFYKYCFKNCPEFFVRIKLSKDDFLNYSCENQTLNETLSFPVHFRASIYNKKIGAFLSMPDTGDNFGPQGYIMKYYNLTFYKKNLCLASVLENISQNITLFNFSLPYDFKIYPPKEFIFSNETPNKEQNFNESIDKDLNFSNFSNGNSLNLKEIDFEVLNKSNNITIDYYNITINYP
ncbi:MAG TPA: hypothetical protein EYH39_02380 [Desulfurobacteriaceae bacterium]|nr:hypothetical protein [Desulfurobacteriaceae bacterium]